MQKIKVIIVLVLALALLPACTNTTDTAAKVSPTPVLDRIMKKGELVVGTAGSMPPLNMTTKNGEIIYRCFYRPTM